jgi:uncharacterized phage protein (TIGR02218 family)
MKTLPPGMQAHLDSGVTTLCWCWKLTCRDGAVLGFTDHDETVTLAGCDYAAISGFTASEVQSTLGLAVDNLTVLGALSAASLNEADLAAGRYDDAAIEIWRVNWAAPAQRVLMRKGELGEVKRGRTAFAAEVRGLAHRLNRPTGRIFAYGCDADLGDARCGKDISSPAFSASGSVAIAHSARRFTAAGLATYPAGWFSGGRLSFTTGANAGRAGEVKRHGRDAIELWQAMSEAIASGDLFDITAGCDKQFATCRQKFANGINFRGFPYMPGNDAALAVPSSSQVLDGGSRYGN